MSESYHSHPPQVELKPIRAADVARRYGATNTWTESKAAGDVGETAAADMLRTMGFRIRRIFGFAGSDLLVSASVEVKHDRRAAATGNLAVEVSYKGEPSGIAASESDAWCIILADEILLLPTANLRALVESGGYRRVSAGDGGAATVALVPVADVRGIAYRLPLLAQGGAR